MRIKLRKEYDRADGAVVFIDHKDKSDGFPYRDSEGYWYSKSGVSAEQNTFLDLVQEHIEQAPDKPMILPSDPAARKGLPITTGVLDYFPLALAEVARVSKAGNDQHNPGQPLHWEKGLSTDHADCIPRHLIDRGARDTDGMRHSAKLAWRALALLQTELENEAKQ